MKDYCEKRILTENLHTQANIAADRKEIFRELSFIKLYCSILGNLFDRHDIKYVEYSVTQA